MTESRFRYVWKVLYQMHRLAEYSHIFSNGASLGSMMYYVEEWRRRMGYGPISKAEVKETLQWAARLGWVRKVSRNGAWVKLPSRYEFVKG